MSIPSLFNRHGERLDASYHPGAEGRSELLVIGHGVTANKDRPFLVALAEGASSLGLACLRFSFSGNGASQGTFAASTVSREVDDLGAVLDAFPGRELLFAGHSMGGAVGVLRASQDERIRGLISLAGMVHTARFAERKFGELTPGQDCMWDKPECPLSQLYMDDMRSIDSVVALAPLVKVPWLLVHGSDDGVVPLQDSRDALEVAGGPAELKVLEGADHVFSDEASGEMVAAVLAWLEPRLA